MIDPHLEAPQQVHAERGVVRSRDVVPPARR